MGPISIFIETGRLPDDEKEAEKGVGIAFQVSDLAYTIFSSRLWESASPSKSRTWLTESASPSKSWTWQMIFSSRLRDSASPSKSRTWLTLFSPADSRSRHLLLSLRLGLHFLQPTQGVGSAFQVLDLAYIIFSSRLWESASPSKSRTWPNDFLQPAQGVGIAFQVSDLAYVIFCSRLWESASPSKSRTWLTFSPANSGKSASPSRSRTLLNNFLQSAQGVGIASKSRTWLTLFSPADSGSRHHLPSLRLGLHFLHPTLGVDIAFQVSDLAYIFFSQLWEVNIAF
ncbi:hypothetical protein SESBI_23822 [Sesbania bispinosa]|nr:hypothetical protein SESBI_23822 [Sesbania bispinosa]